MNKKQDDQADDTIEEVKSEEISKGLEEFKNKVQELEDQSRLDRDQLKRAVADYENLQKRTAQERHEWIVSANKELILRILPVLDTLELAGKHINDQGLKLSIQQFIDALKNEGVERIETKDKDFDPHTMEAVSSVEGKENKVVDQLRAGYIMNDKVLRPAQVTVGEGKNS